MKTNCERQKKNKVLDKRRQSRRILTSAFVLCMEKRERERY